MEAKNNKMYVVRCAQAGVFFGEIKERKGDEVTMTNVRKLWYWDGACAVEQLAVDGTSSPERCKFTVMVSEMVVTGAIQVLACTDKAASSLAAVGVWKR